MTISETLSRAINEALLTLELPKVSFAVEHPSDISHGDYATNVALIIGKNLGRNPKEVAEAIVSELNNKNIKEVLSFEVAGPGFINIRLSRQFFADSVKNIIEQKNDFGKNSIYAGKKILVEYTSPNLFKPLHIGNLMSNIVGESLSRLIEAGGAEVKRINYPSDIGLTVAKGVWALRKNGGNPDDISALGKAYQEGNMAYENDESAKKEIEAVNKALYEDSDLELSELRKRGIETSKKHLNSLCEILGTVFDFEIFESQSSSVGKSIVESHIEDGIFEKSQGAIIFRGEKFGLHTRVFINAMGLPTYEAKDIGLADLKRKLYDFDLSITTTAVEQLEYFKVLIKATEKVFPEMSEKIKHIPYGFLTLKSGKMSSRKGNVITAESLIGDLKEKALEKMASQDVSDKEETALSVTVSAIKYSVLKQSTGKNVIFDEESSLSFHGDSGPYLQYTAVRARSVLNKASKFEISALPSEVSFLERLLYRFGEVIKRAQGEYEPHYVASFITEVAAAFNTYYSQTKIIEDSPESSYRLALTEATEIVIKNGLHVLGISVPDKM